MLAFITHGSRSGSSDRTAGYRGAAPARPHRRRSLGDIQAVRAPARLGDSSESLGVQLFNNALAAGSVQSSGPIMTPALSVSTSLPWAVAPLLPVAPGSGGIVERKLGTRGGRGLGCGCGCDGDSSSPASLLGMPWWVWVGGVALLSVGRGKA